MVLMVPPPAQQSAKTLQKLLRCEMSSDNELSGSTTWAWNPPWSQFDRSSSDPKRPRFVTDTARRGGVTLPGPRSVSRWELIRIHKCVGEFQGQAHTFSSSACSFLQQVFVVQQHSLSNLGGGGNVIEVRQGVGGCLGQMTGFKWHLRECREWGFASRALDTVSRPCC